MIDCKEEITLTGPINYIYDFLLNPYATELSQLKASLSIIMQRNFHSLTLWVVSHFYKVENWNESPVALFHINFSFYSKHVILKWYYDLVFWLWFLWCFINCITKKTLFLLLICSIWKSQWCTSHLWNYLICSSYIHISWHPYFS